MISFTYITPLFQNHFSNLQLANQLICYNNYMATYTFMSLNLMCDKPYRMGNQKFKNRFLAIQEMIRFYDPDIIGVQELTEEMIPYLESISEKYTFYGKARNRAFRYANERCCILYRKDQFELLEGDTFWLSQSPQKSGSRFKTSVFPRIATFALLEDKTNGHVFSVCNTHLDHLLPSTRTKQCRVLKKELYKKQRGEFTVVTGDFNTHLTSVALQGLLSSDDNLHLKDAVGLKGKSTLHSKISSSTHQFKAIDHIFVSDHVKILKTQTISSLFMGMYPSDHLPVITTISTDD